VADRTIFDLYVPKDQRDEAPQEPQRGQGAQAVREVGLGVAQGAGDVAQLMGMLEAAVQYPMSKAMGLDLTEGPPVSPGQEARYTAADDQNMSFWQKMALLDEDDDLMPMMRVPAGRKALDEALEQIPEEGILQESVRRVTRSAPALVAGPGAMAGMVGMEAKGLAAKEAAKAMGAGENVQLLADILGSMTPTKAVLQPGAKNKQLVEFARKMGMKEAEIAPLVQGEAKQKLLANIAKKTGKTERQLKTTREALSGAYDTLRRMPAAETVLATPQRNALVSKMESLLQDMPAKVRGTIADDLRQFESSMMSGDDIIKFYQDVNYNVGPKTKQLTRLKEPLKEALSTINPELGRDFNLTNKLYQRYSDISRKLRPSMIDTFISKSEPYRVLIGLTTGMNGILMEALAEGAGRRLASAMLTNPRLQNISRKMVTSMNTGRINAMQKLTENYINEIAKDHPEAARQLRSIDWEEVRAFIDAGKED